MTSTTGTSGRLGNQIIRNLAVSLIAEKGDLFVKYSSYYLIKQLGIDLFSGSKKYDKTQVLNDDNYFSIYNCDNIDYNLNPNDSFFQTKEISNLLYNHLNTDIIKSKIIDKNPYKERYQNNNDLFVHIRLTDVSRFNPGITYYLNAIKSISFENLYISTDDKNHNIISTIMKLYPDAKLINYNEINTFQFGSTNKNIILSHGSFSSIIGYLGFFSNIYYPEYEANKIWYGDMFSIEKWTKLHVK
jgi:hypothetical protein